MVCANISFFVTMPGSKKPPHTCMDTTNIFAKKAKNKSMHRPKTFLQERMDNDLMLFLLVQLRYYIRVEIENDSGTLLSQNSFEFRIQNCQ